MNIPASPQPTAAPDDTDAWSLPLIGTKMSPPRLPRGWVQRHASQPALTPPRQGGLTLVVAPAGFGKTTLLAEWCQALRRGPQVAAWVSLDAEDDDLQQFGAYVLTALRHASQGALHRAHELLRRDPLTPVKTVITVLLNELAASPVPVFLVLDDFDRLHSPAITDTVVRLLRYAPPHFHIVVGGRAEPALGLGELRARDQLQRLDEEALRFSAEEAERFLATATGRPLDPAGVAQLHHATEGWVAGLQLAALALRKGGGAGQALQGLADARRGIAAYLDEAVLAQLPPPVREFLLRSALLDRFCAPFCDAVLPPGLPPAAQMLDWLERHHVFLRRLEPVGEADRLVFGVDAPAPWFRYHHLLADALCQRLVRERPDELPGLHRRASVWLAGQGLWAEAVRHALAGGDLAQAADWVEQQAGHWVDRSDVRTLLGWTQRLPPAWLAQRPRLVLARAWALALSLQTEEAEQALGSLAPGLDDPAWWAEVDAVRALNAGLADHSGASLALGRQAAARIAQVQAAGGSVPAWVQRFAETAMWFGAMYEGGAAVQGAPPTTALADSLGPLTASDWPAPVQRRAEPIYATVYRESMFGLAAWVEGRLSEAHRRFSGALAQAEQAVGRDSAAAVLPAGYLAGLHHERGEPEAAAAMMEGRLPTALQGCALGSLLRLGRARAGQLVQAGDSAAALDWLSGLRQLAAQRRWPRLAAGADAEAVRLLLRAGRLADAQAMVRQRLLPSGGAAHQCSAPTGSYLETWAFHLCTDARLALAREAPEQAVALLAPLQARLEAAGLVAQAGGVALLHGLALAAAGQGPAAQQVLVGVLPWLVREQVLTPVADEGAPLRRLLRALSRDLQAAPASRSQAEWLLARLADTVPAAVEPAWALRFSHRERDILSHLARGLSNKEIGRALGVAPETVKWHLKNVFAKLDVGSRNEALRCLHQAGWPPA